MRQRPKVLLDIKPTPNTDIFLERNKRVNLSTPSRKRFPKHLLQISAILLFVSLSIGTSAFAPVGGDSFAQANTDDRAALEAELKQLEGKINAYEQTISTYKKQGDSLKGEIAILEARIKKIKLQIKAINISLEKLANDIGNTTSKIEKVENRIDTNKSALASLIRKVYKEDDKGLMEVLLQNPKLSDFFGNINDLFTIQDSLRVSIDNLAKLHDDLMTQKEILAMQKSDAESLREYQMRQITQVAEAKGEKDNLLKVTKGKESAYQKLLAVTKKTAAEIRSRIFELLGGGQLTFEKAYEFAKFAEQSTGIRAALILSVLDGESSLGRNVGKCRYDVNPYYPGRASNKTTMHPTRDIPKFLSITKKLGLDPATTLVSCPIPSDGAYGGAMGPAQFIPSTWVLYENSISKITGNKPSSPWKNSDAFVATALYLKDAYNSSSCRKYSKEIPSQTKILLERCAAAKYYAGGGWYNFRWAYGEPVRERADSFQKDIDVLNS